MNCTIIAIAFFKTLAAQKLPFQVAAAGDEPHEITILHPPYPNRTTRKVPPFGRISWFET
jgi:hypothetical protein